MKLLFTILLLSITQLSFGKTIEELVELNTGSGTLHGTILTPDTKKPVPIVLIISGSGPTDRNGNNTVMTNNSLKLVAEGLADKKIASLRYDKRGVGESIPALKDESTIRFDTYVQDASKWVQMLRTDERFSEVIVLGHSEGALIGAIVSKNQDVSKFISLAGTGRKACDIMIEQFEQQPLLVREEGIKILESLNNGELVPEDSISPLLKSTFRSSVQPYLISWNKYNPTDIYTRIKCPILIIQGSTDIQVQEKDAKLLHEANEASQYILLEGMNHILKDAPEDRTKNMATYSNPDLPLSDGLLESIIKFIK